MKLKSKVSAITCCDSFHVCVCNVNFVLLVSMDIRLPQDLREDSVLKWLDKMETPKKVLYRTVKDKDLECTFV